jgi:GalNAc-alpha-(1->4)-GalNAc-alpha-(1->3)-diNAcBac-PP-undecaprenol alpha-1,4-N-acetyl-D-galactosaminyltransferase
MGGMERASSNLANMMSSVGGDVIYLAIFQHSKFFSLLPSVILDEPTDGSNINSLSFWKTVLRIRRRIFYYNPDCILVYNKFYAALASLALINTNYDVFISERSSPFFKWSLKLRLIIAISFKLRPPQGIIAQTRIAASYQRKYYPRQVPIKVIPNAVRDMVLYPNVDRENFILAVGRMNDYLKGFERLIEAMKYLDTDWPLVIAGGDDDPTLRKKIVDLGLENKVQFSGKVKDMDLLYARAGIFVIPSLSEGFPNALCEAMAAGVPCVSFDFVAGPREMINHMIDGILVEDGNLEELARSISTLIENSDLRKQLGTNAMKIRERLNGQTIAEETLKFILPESNGNAKTQG